MNVMEVHPALFDAVDLCAEPSPDLRIQAPSLILRIVMPAISHKARKARRGSAPELQP